MKRIVLVVLTFALLHFCTCAVVFSQEVELGEIVVTATKTEKELKEVPASVTVITGEELKKEKVQNVDEAISRLVGCYNRRGKGLSEVIARVTLRGFAGQERTLVLIDGQPLNDAYYGGVQWSSIPVDEIERIEVVRGPFSALYGGNAMGGVVNIVTKKAKKLEYNFKTSYGTHNTKYYYLGYKDKIKKLGWSLSYTNKETDGYINSFIIRKPTKSGEGTQVTGWIRTTDSKGNLRYLVGDKGRNWASDETSNFKLNYELTPTSKVSLGLVLSKYKYGYENGKTYLKDLNGSPVNSGYVIFDDGEETKRLCLKTGYFLDGPGGRDTNVYVLSYENILSENLKLKTNLGLSHRKKNWYVQPSSSATETAGSGTYTNTQAKCIQLDVQSDVISPEENIITLGMSFRKEEAEAKTWQLSNWLDIESKSTLNSQAKGKSESLALYFQSEASIKENLKMFIGARYDSWETYDGMSMTSQGTNEYESRSKNSFNPKIAFVYGLNESTTIRLSAGKAFRSPTIYELYRTWISSWGTTYASNPDLKPEVTKSWEIGVDRKFKNIFFKTTYFENSVRDLIYTASTNDPKLKIKENAGKADIKGVEAELNYKITPSLSLFANYTYQDAKITENTVKPESVGKQIPYVPKEMYNVGLRFDKGKLISNLKGEYVSKIYRGDDNSDTATGVYTAMDPYFVLGANLIYKMSPKVEVSLSVNNILNKEYFVYYKAQGRTVNLEINTKF